MNCQDLYTALPDLLLDPASAPQGAEAHLAACAPCRAELASFQATFAALDTWQAPEPSAFFDQKLAVRLREEAANPPAGWIERLQARLLFNTGRHFRPAMAGALTAVLVLGVGGGTFASLPDRHAGKAEVSAAVSDLQILDHNDQALQQMDQLLQEDDAIDEGAPPRT